MKVKTRASDVDRHLNDLRQRIVQLSLIEDKKLFFQEVARLVDWIESTPIFNEPITYLELLRQKEEAVISTMLRTLYEELKIIWEDLLRLNWKNTAIPESVLKRRDHLNLMYSSPYKYSALDFYRSLKYLVEELVCSEYPEDLTKYDEKLAAGRVDEIISDYEEKNRELKNKFENSNWGSWAMLKQVLLLSKTTDADYQLTKWSEVFKKDEYYMHLNKVADFIFESDNKKFNNEINSQLEENSIWRSDFKVENHTLNLAEYGNVPFDPQKSPLGNVDTGSVERFVDYIVSSGTHGVPSKEVKQKLSLADNDIGSFIAHLNNRFEKLFNKGELLAIVRFSRYGKRGNQMIKLTVIPKTFVPQPLHSTA